MRTVCQMMYDVAKGPKMAMEDRKFKQAQQSYDRMEHPDYWEDREEEYEREAEMKQAKAEYDAEHDPDYDIESEHRMEWDELSDAGRQRRMERNYEMADMRRDEIRDEQMMRGLPGDHDGRPSNEQMEYFKRGGR